MNKYITLVPLFLALSQWTQAASGKSADLEKTATSGGGSNIELKDAFEIRAGTDASKASIKASFGDISYGDYSAKGALSLSAPLDKNNDVTKIAAFDGFVNSSAISLGSTIYRHKFDGTEIESIYLGGFSSSVGHKSFDYTDASNLSEKKTTKTPYSAGVFLGSQIGKSASFVVLSFDYKSEYKDAKSKGVVLPADGTGREFVRTGPFGAPVRQLQSVVSIDLRSSFALSKGGDPIAYAIKCSYDLKSEEYGIDLPIVFLSGGDDKRWNGGIQFSYQSKEDKFYVSLFAGAPFQIIPK
jgi:hypothetical protein